MKRILLSVLLLCSLTTNVQAKTLRDIAYGSNPAQRIDVYLPHFRHQAPIIVMVHGGAWNVGDKADPDVVRNKKNHWVSQDYIFISVNYRLVPSVHPLQQADDVASALAFIQRNAVKWGGDPEQIVMIGHSAGAHLIGLLSVDPRLAAHAGAERWRGSVLLDTAAVDVSTIMQDPHSFFYDRAFGKDPNFWYLVSPDLRMTKDAVPMLVICSVRHEQSCHEAHKLEVRAQALGITIPVIEEDISHQEIDNVLGLPGDYTESVDEFIDSVLQNNPS